MGDEPGPFDGAPRPWIAGEALSGRGWKLHRELHTFDADWQAARRGLRLMALRTFRVLLEEDPNIHGETACGSPKRSLSATSAAAE